MIEADPAYARAMLDKHGRDSYQANVTGSGAIAQGQGATAVGAGGVLVRGKTGTEAAAPIAGIDACPSAAWACGPGSAASRVG